MADHDKDLGSSVESVKEKIAENLRDHVSPSSSDSEHAKSSASSLKSTIYRLFGRQKPLHNVLGGGKRMELEVYYDRKILSHARRMFVISLGTAADVFLWRNKKISASVLGGATAIWVLFELLEYHLLTLVCHVLILSLAIVFLWSNASVFINKSPPRIPEVVIPEKLVLEFASALRIEINRAFAALREIASGRDLKKFLTVITVLWVLSIMGSWCNFWTLFYITFVLLHTVPVLYEKYEDQIDSFAEKAMVEIKKQYAVFEAQVLSKIPRGSLKDKKKA